MKPWKATDRFALGSCIVGAFLGFLDGNNIAAAWALVAGLMLVVCVMLRAERDQAKRDSITAAAEALAEWRTHERRLAEFEAAEAASAAIRDAAGNRTKAP